MGPTENFEQTDFLSDPSLLEDPYPYYDYLRECPVRRVPPNGTIAVTGCEEAVKVWRDTESIPPLTPPRSLILDSPLKLAPTTSAISSNRPAGTTP